MASVSSRIPLRAEAASAAGGPTGFPPAVDSGKVRRLPYLWETPMPIRALPAAMAVALLTACAAQAPSPAGLPAATPAAALPLDVLEAKVDRWIASQQAG
jgi:hypothetical protein